jgi:hypothetical protein
MAWIYCVDGTFEEGSDDEDGNVEGMIDVEGTFDGLVEMDGDCEGICVGFKVIEG